MKYVEHPLIRPGSVEEREYQLEIVRKAYGRNLLIVLPTGLGKTTIALILTAELIREDPEVKVVFLAPTKPLIDQHYNYFKSNLLIEGEKFAILTGEIKPSRRELIWRKAQIIFATPQVVLNDLLSNKFKIEGKKYLFIFDEAHRAVGNYPYTRIVDLISHKKRRVRILALTASPGDEQKIREIMENLLLENLVIKTRENKEVRRYVQYIQFSPIKAKQDLLTEKIILNLKKMIKKALKELNESIGGKLDFKEISFKKLEEIRRNVEEKYWRGEIGKSDALKSRTLIFLILRLDKLLTYIETYSYSIFKLHLDKILQKGTHRGRSVEKVLLSADEIKEIKILIDQAVENGFLHPKMKEALKVVKGFVDKGSRVIVFVSIRSVAQELKNLLLSAGVNAGLLIGQRKNGMKQNEQIRAVSEFKSGKINPIITTQIGEEGLDISDCDVVVFYDNPISAIRRIQRTGRTGRRFPGKVVFIILEKSRDEARYWVGFRMEKKLMEKLRNLKLENVEKIKITDFMKAANSGKIKLVVDYREAKSKVVDYLKSRGVNLEITDLSFGDYVISDRIVIERKRVEDFAASLIDSRLFKQAKSLKQNAELPLVILEGNLDKIILRTGEEQIFGALVSLLIDFKIDVLRSSNERETAQIIYSLLKREAEEKRKPKVKIAKLGVTDDEIQRQVVASLPGINYILADRLLKKFQTVEKIFTASIDELLRVKGVGLKTAERIREIITKRYKRLS